MNKEKTKTNNVPYAVEPNQPTTSGKTENYGLPQWEGSDITDWFELNPAFAKIDEAMHANEVSAQIAQNTADSNTTSVGNLTESLNNTISRVTAAENVNTQQTQQITLNTTHLNEHDTAIQANTTAIQALQNEGGEQGGDIASLQADVTTLQGKVTTAERNIITNADHIGNISELETSANTNLVVAINEIKKQPSGNAKYFDGQFLILASQNDTLTQAMVGPVALGWKIKRFKSIAQYAYTTNNLNNVRVDINLENFLNDVIRNSLVPSNIGVYLIGFYTANPFAYSGYFRISSSFQARTMPAILPTFLALNNPVLLSTGSYREGDNINGLVVSIAVPIYNPQLDNLGDITVAVEEEAVIQHAYSLSDGKPEMSYVLAFSSTL